MDNYRAFFPLKYKRNKSTHYKVDEIYVLDCKTIKHLIGDFVKLKAGMTSKQQCSTNYECHRCFFTNRL